MQDTQRPRDSRPEPRDSGWLPRALVLAAACLIATACRPVRFEAVTNIPEPLIVKIPVVAGLYIPEDFANYVHKEERWGTKWEVRLGPAQAQGITRLMNAMFERVVILDSVMGATTVDPAIRGVLEPAIEQFSFVTPRDATAPFYAVSIKYRVDLYTPDGKLLESWPFTGYGSASDSGFGGQDPLRLATSAAMRDAGAKLAVEFREQAVVRGLLVPSEGAPGPGDGSQLPSEGAPAAAEGSESTGEGAPAEGEGSEMPRETGPAEGEGSEMPRETGSAAGDTDEPGDDVAGESEAEERAGDGTGDETPPAAEAGEGQPSGTDLPADAAQEPEKADVGPASNDVEANGSTDGDQR